MKKIIFSILFLITFFHPDLAWASTLNLSPGSGSVEVGKTISVKVNLNTGGEAVNAVAAYLTYPLDLLDVTYVTAGGSFSIEAEKSFGGGIIKISRGSISPVKGNVNVATIGFKGKVLGKAVIAFTAGSAAPRASDSTDSLSPGSNSGGTINVVKSSSVSKVVTEKLDVTKAPVISAVNVLNISTSSATISWKTDQPSDSTVEYGLEKGLYFLNASDGNLLTEHKVVLASPLLTPGASFHFRVLSKDLSNNLSVSEDMSFQLIGYTVTLKIVSSDGTPVKNSEVLIYSEPKKGMTDEKGEVSFENMTPGKHLVVIKSSLIEKTAEIDVKKTPDIQKYELNLDLLAKNFKLSQSLIDKMVAGVLVAGIIGLIIIGIFYLIHKKKN